MSSEQIRVTFEPHGKTVFVLRGATVLEAAALAGLTIDTPCGGQGLCGKCRVQVTSGACAPSEVDAKLFSRDELDDGWRLACQTQLCGQAVVHIPENSLFGSYQQILTEAKSSEAVEVLPSVRKEYVELAPPTLEDDDPDVMRLSREIGKLKVDLELLDRKSVV